MAVPEGGYAHMGVPGSGHYAKMVHNGIEYGLLQAYAEGISLLSAAPYEFDIPAVAEVWRHGSLIRSWLLDLIVRVLDRDAQVADYLDYAEDLGTGRWTALEAIHRNVPAPVITMSVLSRIDSRQDSSYSNRLIAAVREEFGGHRARRISDEHA
jgi:6-phosphogluconate dehydrogenase